MMKHTTLKVAVTAGILMLGITAFAVETKPEPKKQTNCPVMQRQPIDKSLYIDVQGKRVYVCCKGCINQIKADPDGYIKPMEATGVVFEKAPAEKDNKKKDT